MIYTIDNFFTEDELKLVWKELEWATSPYRLISSLDSGSQLEKTNHLSYNPRVIFKERQFSSISQICWNKIFLNEDLKTEVKKLNVLYGNIDAATDLIPTIKYYEDSQEYKPHTDFAQFTSCIYLYKQPKQFTGGNLYFPEIDTEIECTYNKFVMFGSGLQHGVRPIKMNRKDLMHGEGRYCIINWLCRNEADFSNDKKV